MKMRRSEKITSAWAICYGCQWESEANAAVHWGQNHAEQTGHKVEVNVERTTTFTHAPKEGHRP